MTNPLDSTLTQAYELIEANRIDEARDLLTPLLNEHPDNADLWWVYAHAVDDPAQARLALENVKRLDGDYSDLDTLLAELADVAPAAAPVTASGIRQIRPLSASRSTPPTSLPELPTDSSFDDDFDDDFSAVTESEGGRNWSVLGALAFSALLIGAVLLFALFRPRGDAPPATQQVAVNPTDDVAASIPLGVPSVEVATDAPTAVEELPTFTALPTDTEVASSPTNAPVQTEEATQIVAQAIQTEEATEIAQDMPTEEAAPPVETDESTEVVAQAVQTEEPTDTATNTNTPRPPTDTPQPTDTPEPTPNPSQQALALFSEFDLYEEEPIRTISDDDTDSALVAVCLTPQDNRNTVLSETMATLVDLPDSIIEDFDQLGITLFDCEAEQVIRSIVVPADVLTDFIDEEIAEREFQLAWQPIE